MVSDPKAKTRAPAAHVVLAVVLQVREGRLQVLLWERALRAVPRRLVAPRRRPRAGRDARAVDPPPPRGEGRRPRARAPRAARDAAATPTATRCEWELATAYLGLVPSDVDPERPRRHALAPGRRAAGARVRPPRDRARRPRAAAGEALVHEHRLRARARRFTISELRDLYRAALGHDVSATNLQRVLLRRGLLVPTGERREPGRAGGRPAALFRFRSRRLEITDQFAVLRPPG